MKTGLKTQIPAGILLLLFWSTMALVAFSTWHAATRADLAETTARLLLVATPFFACVSLAGALIERLEQRVLIGLHVRKFPESWSDIRHQVDVSWLYERDRFLKSSQRIRLSAYHFGGLASLILAGCVLAVEWDVGKWLGTRPPTAKLFALTLATATVTSFGLNFARVFVRVASQDYNSRMFAWAMRSVLLVALCTAGLFLALRKALSTMPWMETVAASVLLGIFSALLGEKALPLLLDKAAAAFGLALPARASTSTLTEIEGVTDEDVERFAEERVTSLHDLAFCPTARLFFNTHHSLQRICDWQDQALLAVYLTPARAKALAQQVGIRGAIDLQGAAREILGVTAPYPPASPDVLVIPDTVNDPKKDALCKPMEKVLAMDRAALLALLMTLYADEPTLRLRMFWQSTPELVPTASTAALPQPAP